MAFDEKSENFMHQIWPKYNPQEDAEEEEEKRQRRGENCKKEHKNSTRKRQKMTKNVTLSVPLSRFAVFSFSFGFGFVFAFAFVLDFVYAFAFAFDFDLPLLHQIDLWRCSNLFSHLENCSFSQIIKYNFLINHSSTSLLEIWLKKIISRD